MKFDETNLFILSNNPAGSENVVREIASYSLWCKSSPNIPHG